MTGYTTEGWGELFLAEAGASAALAGLLFVGVLFPNQPLLAAGGGLYWLVPGLAFSLVVAVVNAWVLLVEVVR